MSSVVIRPRPQQATRHLARYLEDSRPLPHDRRPRGYSALPGAAAAHRPAAYLLSQKPTPSRLRPHSVPLSASPYTVPAGTDIGHTHLKVADLDRALAFYHGVLGFDITQRYGSQAAFVSAGGYHHHIGLNTWESRGGSPPPRGSTGLYHVAIRYPTQRDLAIAVRHVIDAGVPLDGAADHGVSEAIYLRDPDGNGIELYWDRPREEWPRTEGGLPFMGADPLDIGSLLAKADT
jgi:catechol 2,3-dioxygenase